MAHTRLMLALFVNFFKEVRTIAAGPAEQRPGRARYALLALQKVATEGVATEYRAGRVSTAQVAVESIRGLQILGITFVTGTGVCVSPNEAADALFIVHRSRLGARCAAANSGSFGADPISTWGGVAIVDATQCPGSASHSAPRMCRDASVAKGLQTGVQVIAETLASQQSSDASGYIPVCVDISKTSPTLLTAWLLEYPVGYYVAQPAMSNNLGGENLVLFSIRAELVTEAAPQPSWLQLDNPKGPLQASTLCAFSVPLDLLTKEPAIGDSIHTWCTKIGAVLSPAATCASELSCGSSSCVWRHPCVDEIEGNSFSFGEENAEPANEADEQTLISQLNLLPWLNKQDVVLEHVAL